MKGGGLSLWANILGVYNTQISNVESELGGGIYLTAFDIAEPSSHHV